MIDLGYRDKINFKELKLYPIQQVPTIWPRLAKNKVIVCGRKSDGQEYLSIIQSQQELDLMIASQIQCWYCGLFINKIILPQTQLR